MKKTSESRKRIKRLRKVRGENQIAFAKALGVSQATVSSWELGRMLPSPGGYLLLGILASKSGPELDDDAKWFFERADLETVLRASEKILRDRGLPPAEGEIWRVPCIQKGAKGTAELGCLLPMPAESVRNPGSSICLVVDETATSLMFRAGDRMVVDTSDNNAKDLSPFWDQIVLVDTDHMRDGSIGSAVFSFGMSPPGLSMGRLRYKGLKPSGPSTPGLVIGPSSLLFLAILSPFDDFETTWEPGDEGFHVGHWQPNLSKMPDSLEGANAFIVESHRQAPFKIRLEDACRVLGRVIAYFPAQRNTATGEDETANGGMEREHG